MALPPKKPGVGIIIGIGKPKGGPPPLPSLEKGRGAAQDDSGDDNESPDDYAHAEPDADQEGGPSDNDADNKLNEYVAKIATHPTLVHPFSAFLEALSSLIPPQHGGKMPAQDEDQGY